MRNLLIRYLLIFCLMGVWALAVEHFSETLNPDSYLRCILRNAALLIPMIGLINRATIHKMKLESKSLLLLIVGWTITLVLTHSPTFIDEPISIARWSNFVFLSPFLEEVVFRGFFLPKMAQHVGKLKAVLFSSALFSVMHLPQFLIFGYESAEILQNLGFITVLGVVFAILTLWSKRLWPAILAHSANNCLAFF